MENYSKHKKRVKKINAKEHPKSIVPFKKKRYGSKDAPVHGLSLDIAEPDPQIWSEVLTCQLQHGDVAPSV